MATEKLSNEDLIKQKKEVLDLKERNLKILLKKQCTREWKNHL